MKKILLACNLGMSTSLLVANMQKYAKKENIAVEIIAVPVNEAERILLDWDIVMIGPQVRYKMKSLEKVANGRVPVALIDMRDYGLMDGENVLKAALIAMG